MQRAIILAILALAAGSAAAQVVPAPPANSAPIGTTAPSAASPAQPNTENLKPETASSVPAKAAPIDPKDPHSWLWQFHLAGFTEKDYRAAVDALFADYEKRLDRKLAPGPKRRVGIKVMTATPGLTTPLALVRAVIGALEARGFKPEEIYIVDQNETSLRTAGFLPPPAVGGNLTFDGVPVLVLESGKYYEAKSDANYEDPLQPPDWDVQQRIQQLYDWKFAPTDRISLAPVALLRDTNFWINLPVGMDQEQLGFSGALVNASLLFCSNTQRFFLSRSSGQIAIANILGNAPEFRAGWVFSILSLERYQYIGGPRFNSLYNASEPTLLFSPNPVVLDSLLFERMNLQRRAQNFPLLERPAYLDYARQSQIGLGDYDPARVYRVQLP